MVFKMKTSYHTHTKRCKHGKGNVNDFVNFAIANNFEVIGFTDHVPFKDNRMDFCRMFYSELDEYISEIMKSCGLQEYHNVNIQHAFIKARKKAPVFACWDINSYQYSPWKIKPCVNNPS